MSLTQVKTEARSSMWLQSSQADWISLVQSMISWRLQPTMGGSASSLADLDIPGLASDWRRRQENRAKATIIFIFMKYVIVNSVAADCLLLSQNEFYRPVISTIWTF